MNKRAHGEGSITQLPSGAWRARVTVDGKRLSYTAATRKEVVDWIRITTGQIEQGLTFDATKITLGQYLTDWLASTQDSIRPTTYAHYKILVEKRLVPTLGKYIMKDISADKIQHVYDTWKKSGTGVATIQKAHAVLHEALERAAQTGLIVKNPSDYVSLPRKAHQEMKFWTEAEANQFLTNARSSRLYALFHLALATGARQMELLGLQWSDLEWSTGKLQIQRQLSRSGEMFADLKTKAGKRTILLGQSTIDALREHYNLQDEERRIAGDRWQEHNLIFTSLVGTPMHHKNLMDRYFKPLVKAAGVPEIRFHDLRHTAVAILLSHGVSVFAVSKRIGHARPSITSDIYGHLVPGAGDSLGQLMDDLITPIPVARKSKMIGHGLDTEE